MVDTKHLGETIMKKLTQSLKNYEKEVDYRFHMPGHKGILSWEPIKKALKYDVTEVDGTDNLMHPSDGIKSFMEEMKGFYATEKTYISVNGSTGGLMTAIGTVCKRNDEILIQRDVHKSIYNAIEIMGLKPIYIKSKIDLEWGIPLGIDLNELERILKIPNKIKAVVVTHPNYYGIGQEIENLVKIAHKFGKIVIVDEAHGAHLPFLKENNVMSSLKANADIVVESMHKTLPALTQTALIHLNTKKISPEKLEKKLFTFQTTSPSYLLMSSMEFAFHWMKENGNAKLQELKTILEEYISKIEKINGCEVFKIENTDYKTESTTQKQEKPIIQDFTKLVVSMDGYTGFELENILRKKERIQVEMADLRAVTLIITAVDTKEGLELFYRGLKNIANKSTDKDKNILKKEKYSSILSKIENIELEQATSIECAFEADNIYVGLKKSEGFIGADFIIPYPPGIPLLVPGEVISKEIIEYIIELKSAGAEILGVKNNEISVVKEI